MAKVQPGLVRILLVEDDEDDYVLTRDMLSHARMGKFQLVWVTSGEAAWKALQQETPDVVLVDFRLQHQNGLELIETAVKSGIQIPFILLTGDGSYEVDLQAMQAGAMDYLVKGEVTPSLLERSIRYAIERQRLIAENRKQKELFQKIVETEASGIAIMTGPDLVFQVANPAYRAIVPHPEIDPVGRPYVEIWPPEEGFERHIVIRRVLETGEPGSLAGIQYQFNDGTRHTLYSYYYPLSWMDEPAVLAVVWETTALEEARSQAERSAQEARLRAAEAEQGFRILQALMEYIPEGIAIADAPDGMIRMVSNYGLEFTSGPPGSGNRSQGAERPARSQVYHPDGITPTKPEELPLSRAIQQGEVVMNEEWIIRREGHADTVALCNAGPIRDRDGNIIHGVFAWRDVTEQVNARKQVEAEQARLKAVIQNAPQGIVVADKECRILLTNPAADEIYRRPVPLGEDFNSHAQLQLCYPDGTPYAPRDLPLTRSALDGETIINAEMRIVWPDGQSRALLVNSAPIYDSKGNVDGAVGIFQDMTQIRQVEAEVAKGTAQIEVQRRLIQQRELERLEIAQDLHDGPLQELIGVSFALCAIRDMAEDNVDLQETVGAITDSLQAQIRDLRTFCNELRPPALAPFGLEKAIRSHIETFSTLHPELDLNLDLMTDRQSLPEPIRMAFFRIYQELLHNVVKHACASSVQIRFWLDPNQATLEMEDDGCGFDIPEDWVNLARQGHLGLAGIQERASAIGGSIQIDSQAGVGTTIRVSVPYENLIHPT